MTSLELSDLIQQQLNENPVLEEVATQEEAQELAEKILDHMASGGDLDNLPGQTVEATAPEPGTPSSNGSNAETEIEFVSESEGEITAGGDAEGGGLEAGEDAGYVIHCPRSDERGKTNCPETDHVTYETNESHQTILGNDY